MKNLRPLVIFSILAVAFLALASAAQAGPAAQTAPVPDPNGLTVYGIGWMLVGAVIAGLLIRFAGLTENGALIFSAGWAVAGYLLVQNLADLETALPWLPTYLPQVLMAILIFGSVLGTIQAGRATWSAGKRAYSVLRK